MKTLAIVMLLAAIAVPASAGIVWNESINGDLSSSEAAPTAIAFGVGSNQILGAVSGSPLDRDFITFTIVLTDTGGRRVKERTRALPRRRAWAASPGRRTVGGEPSYATTGRSFMRVLWVANRHTRRMVSC